ncbi:class I SAM-dependent methyltransferase [uncultured Cellulomonas sp.]|uniref:class I SAM-dependent methyltransferase n=1 Tax=uncultured Cellulomonas sp. TaxID=189682 RepID=UPI0028F0FFCE|nr:class I SAM-dependent methyltransferase [uncultured Cellulomonas sp.]
MNLMTDEQYADFFEPYAGNVEKFYESAYWRLSDELIKELVRRHLDVTAGGHVVDMGGGTGRWGLWLARELGVSVTVADKSVRMLEEARQAVADSGLTDVHLVECDIEDAPELGDQQFDAVISTYGVLSFLNDPAAAFRTVHRVLKPGGVGLLMSHSLSNALTSKVNRDGAGPAELRELLETRIVRWAPHVPPLRVYSADDLRRLATDAGLEAPAVFGVTSIAYPGPEDFGYPYTSVSGISASLEVEEYFRTALDLELAASEQTDWAERGVNLMVKVVRPSTHA